MKNTKKKITFETIRGHLISILSTIFILFTSLIIFYFSKGYRINIFEKEITKTGVLTVQTEPSSANVYVNSEDIGRTPRSRTLGTGFHNISVWKQDYREWKKKIDIIEEKSSPIYPFLLLENIQKESLWRTENTLEKFWINESRDLFVFLEKSSDNTYSIWGYKINTVLWDFNQNPYQIITLGTNNIGLNISPSGHYGILEIFNDNETNRYFVDMYKTQNLEDLTNLNLPDLAGYTQTWAKDNKHLILESSEEILSVDTTKNIKYLLIRKTPNEKYVWTTDSSGSFYIVETLPSENDTVYTYSLKQTKLDGSNPRKTIDTVFFQKNIEYAEYYRSNGEEYPEFTNSSEATQAIGQIISLEVNQESKGLYIKTDTCTYWYDISKNRYKMISPYPVELLSFSPDSRKLLFENGTSLYVFTFNKEDADHTETLGSSKIGSLLKTDITNIQWLSNSTYLSYIKNNNIFISEKDGENEQSLLSIENTSLYSISNSKEYLFTIEKEDNSFVINKYKIN